MADQDRIVINKERHEVFVSGKRVRLSPSEYRLLAILKGKANQTLNRQYLLEQMWDSDKSWDKNTRTIDQHVSRLRKKLKTNSIETVPTFGYRWSRESNG